MSDFRTETHYDEEGYLVTKRYFNEEPNCLNVFEDSESKETKTIKLPQFKLWIIDLLNIDKDNKSEHYNFCGFTVHIVDIYGVVSEVCPNRFGVLYKVDDGTGEIGCWNDNRNMTNKQDIQDSVKSAMAGIYERNLDNTVLDNSVFSTTIKDIDKSATSAEVEAAQWLERRILNYAETENNQYGLGDTVHLRGKLVDFRGERCIRIYNIRLVTDINEETDRRFELFHLYKTLYSTKKS